MTPKPVTISSGYSLRKNYGVKLAEELVSRSGGFTGTPFIWTYFDIVIDTITDGKLTEIQSLVANGASDSEIATWESEH